MKEIEAPQTEFAEKLEAADVWAAFMPIRSGIGSHQAWIRDNPMQVFDYLEKNFHPEDVSNKYRELLATNPAKLRALVADHSRPNRDKFRAWLKYLGTEDGKLGLMLGGKGKWKTSTVNPVAYYVWKWYGRRICALTLGDSLPHKDGEQFLHRIVTPEEAPRGSLVLIDEANRTFNSRNSMGKTQRALGEYLSTLRHRECSAVAISQNSTMADINLSRMVDFIWIKPLGYSQAETERGHMKNFLKAVEEILPLRPQQNAIFWDKGPPMTFWMDRAPWWKKEFSFSFAGFTNDEEGEQRAIPIATALRRGGRDWDEIAREIGGLDLHRDPEFWEDNVIAANDGLDPQTNRPPIPKHGKRNDDDGSEPASWKPKNVPWRPPRARV